MRAMTHTMFRRLHLYKNNCSTARRAGILRRIMSDATTPMMQQYHRLKREVPADALLLFRLGDFYEMFFGDAEEASRLLDLTLTQRQGTPMCGIPHHAAEGYVAQLLKAGRRVAICDQMETPRPGQVVRREITRILTPGTILEAAQLEPKQNNFVGAIAPQAEGFGLAALDLTTGEFFAGDFATAGGTFAMPSGRLSPAEDRGGRRDTRSIWKHRRS